MTTDDYIKQMTKEQIYSQLRKSIPYNQLHRIDYNRIIIDDGSIYDLVAQYRNGNYAVQLVDATYYQSDSDGKKYYMTYNGYQTEQYLMRRCFSKMQITTNGRTHYVDMPTPSTKYSTQYEIIQSQLKADKRVFYINGCKAVYDIEDLHIDYKALTDKLYITSLGEVFEYTSLYNDKVYRQKLAEHMYNKAKNKVFLQYRNREGKISVTRLDELVYSMFTTDKDYHNTTHYLRHINGDALDCSMSNIKAYLRVNEQRREQIRLKQADKQRREKLYQQHLAQQKEQQRLEELKNEEKRKRAIEIAQWVRAQKLEQQHLKEFLPRVKEIDPQLAELMKRPILTALRKLPHVRSIDDNQNYTVIEPAKTQLHYALNVLDSLLHEEHANDDILQYDDLLTENDEVLRRHYGNKTFKRLTDIVYKHR